MAESPRVVNPFADAWRNCLLAHYEYVIREGDWANEASLREVLLSVGVTEETLYAIYQAQAVMSEPAPPAEPEIMAAADAAADMVSAPPAETPDAAEAAEIDAGTATEIDITPSAAPNEAPDESEPPLTQLSLF